MSYIEQANAPIHYPGGKGLDDEEVKKFTYLILKILHDRQKREEKNDESKRENEKKILA